MRFAVFSDAQGNAAAVRAVLRDIDAAVDVDRVVCAGDIVGLGPQPNEVIDLLRERPVETALGNYDDAVAHERLSSGVDFADSETEQADQRAIEWTRRTLTAESMQYLRALPRNLRLYDVPAGIRVKRNAEDERVSEYRRNFLGRALFGGLVQRPVRRAHSVMVVHGSPRALNETVRGDTANSILKAIRAEVQADVLVSGHAGVGFHREEAGISFIGVTSLSGPQAIPGQAEYAVVDVGPDVRVEFRSALYDAAAFRRDMLESGLPQELALPANRHPG